MGPRVIRQLEKILFWSILAPTCGVAAPVIFHISRGVQHERNQVNVGRDQASRGRAFRAKARCVPADGAAWQVLSRNKKQWKYFSHPRKDAHYEKASHRNSSLRRARGAHGGARPGGQGPHARASARRLGNQRERVHRCGVFARGQEHRSRGQWYYYRSD